MNRLLVSFALLAAAVIAAPAPADLNGTWKATAEGPQGNMERTFVFKVDGTKLTGETTSSMLGKSTIADGKVDGDTFSFTITADFGGNQMKISYKGKVSGNEIKVTSSVDGGDGNAQSFEWTGKKVQ